MKKSWIRTLLIVVMALLLIFTLVACNPDKDDNGGSDNPPPYNPPNKEWEGDPEVKAHWDRLWELTSKIGETAVEGDDDLAVELGLQIALNIRNANSDTLYQQIDLGLDIQAVIGGRQNAATAADGEKESTAENTSIKIKLYDPTDSAHTEIAALYLLGSDLDNLYVDFGGKNIKIPHNLVSTVWNEVLKKEGNLIDELPGALNNPFLNIGGEEQSINGLINTFTDAFGADWTLNTLVNSLVKMFGLKDTIENILKENQLIASALGIDNVFDDKGQIDILKILTGEVTTTVFTAKTNESNGVINHKVELNENIWAMIVGMLDDIGKENNLQLGTNLLKGAGSSLSISYNEKVNEIQDFTIAARLGALSTDLDSKTVVPELAIKISSLKIEKANQENKVQIAPASYKTNIALDEQLSFEVSGLTLKNYKDILGGGNDANPDTGVTSAEGDENPDLVLNHRVEIGIQGQLDLIGGRTVVNPNPDGNQGGTADDTAQPTEPQTNQTKLNAYVRIVDLSKTADNVTNIIEASFVNSKLGIKIDSTVAAVAGQVLTEMGFVPDGVNLEGVNSLYLDLDINIADMVHDLVVNIASKIYKEWQLDHPDDPTPDADPNVKTVAFKYGKRYVGEFVKVTKGTALTDEQIPVIIADAGYIFEGWYVGDTKIEAGTVIEEDIIATPKFKEAPTTPEEPTAPKDYGAIIVKAVKIFKVALPYVSTNNNIVVSTNDLLPVVVDICNIWRGQDGPNAKDKWTVENREAAILESLNNPPLDPDNNTVGELIGQIIVILTTPAEPPVEDVPGTTADEPTVPPTEEEPTLWDCVLTLLYKVAPHVEIDGVEIDPEVEGQTMYDAIILAALHGALEVKADAKNGFHLNVNYTFAGAHIGVTEKFEVIETNKDTFKDIYAEYETAVENGGDVSNWLDISNLLPKKQIINVAGNTFVFSGYTDNNGNLTSDQLNEIAEPFANFKFEFDMQGGVIITTGAEGTQQLSGTYEQVDDVLTITVVGADVRTFTLNAYGFGLTIEDGTTSITIWFDLAAEEPIA